MKNRNILVYFGVPCIILKYYKPKSLVNLNLMFVRVLYKNQKRLVTIDYKHNVIEK